MLRFGPVPQFTHLAVMDHGTSDFQPQSLPFPEPPPSTEEPDQHKGQPWRKTFFNYTKLTPPLAQDSAEVSGPKDLFLIKD